MRGIRLGAPAGCRAAATAAALLITSGAGAQFVFDFAPPVVLDIGFDAFPNSIDAGFIDSDALVDLILSGRNNDGFAVIFPGTPGGFGPPVQLDMGTQTNWAVVRDFNTSDGLNDVALSHRAGLGRVSVIAGDGTLAQGQPVVYPVGRSPQLLGTGDLDGDLDLDLVVFNTDTFDVSILHNDGNGLFTPAQRISVNRTASDSASPNWAQILDLDGDDDLDIVTVNIQAHGVVSVLRNSGDGTFETAVQHAVGGIEPEEAMSTLAAADLDGDLDIDLVTKAGGLSFHDRIIVLTNDGTGSFDTALHVQLTSSPWDITTGDFDADGHEDIAWITHAFSSQALGFLRNQGAGVPAFDPPGLELPLGGFPRDLLAYDVDGDTDLDVVVADIGNQRALVVENLHVQAAAAEKGAGSLFRHGNGRIGPGRAAKKAPGSFFPPPKKEPGTFTTIGEAMARLAEWGAPPAAALPGAGAGVCGDPDAGDCFEPHDGPGCDDQDCCTLVCDTFPLCCVTVWDQNCADIANDTCEPPPACPGEGSCFEPHQNLGCDDPVCCELVCGFDPFCCGLSWDQLCADEAVQVCGLPDCGLLDCAGQQTPEPETIDCADRVNDGCNMAEAVAFTPVTCNQSICGTCWTLATRDTDWYEIIVDEPAVLSWSVRAEFPAEIFIVSGTCDDEYLVIASAFSVPCALGVARAAVEPGTYYLYVAPGLEGTGMDRGIGCMNEGEILAEGPYGHRYNAMAACGSGCAEDVSGDGTVGIADLLLLLAAWGTDPGGPPDLDGDGTVGITDFAAMLAAWGPC